MDVLAYEVGLLPYFCASLLAWQYRWVWVRPAAFRRSSLFRPTISLGLVCSLFGASSTALGQSRQTRFAAWEHSGHADVSEEPFGKSCAERFAEAEHRYPGDFRVCSPGETACASTSFLVGRHRICVVERGDEPTAVVVANRYSRRIVTASGPGTDATVSYQFAEVDGRAPTELVEVEERRGRESFERSVRIRNTRNGERRLDFSIFEDDQSNDCPRLQWISGADVANEPVHAGHWLIDDGAGRRLEAVRIAAVLSPTCHPIALSVEHRVCRFRADKKSPSCSVERKPMEISDEEQIDTGYWWHNVIVYDWLLRKEKLLASRGIRLSEGLVRRMRTTVGRLRAAARSRARNQGVRL